MTEICSGLRSTFGTFPNEVLSVEYTLQAKSPHWPFSFEFSLLFTKTNWTQQNGLEPDKFSYYPVEQFPSKQVGEFSRNVAAEESRKKNSVTTELTPIEKIQKTSTLILQFRVYITLLATNLQSFLAHNADAHSTAVEVASNNLPRKQLDAIRDLKKELLTIIAWVDAHLLDYSTQSNPLYDWTKWNELKRHKISIERNLKRLNSTSIRQHLLVGNAEESPQTVLAHIIGFRKELANEIFDFESNHESEEDQIHRYFREMDYSYVQTEGKSTLELYFCHLGFNESRAKYIARRIRSFQFQRHFSPLDFAQLFIEDLFKFDLLLSDELPKLPKDCSGIYFVDSFSYDEGEETRSVQCQNFSSTKEIEDGLKSFLTSSTDDQGNEVEEGSQFWFHGTGTVAASRITEIGISLCEGAERKDFSHKNGFYLSDGFEAALKWNQRRVKDDYSAILRYKIPKQFWVDNMDGIQLSIESPEDMQKWRSIIRYNRSGKEEGRKQMKRKMESIPFILGPLSSDGEYNKKNKDDPNWPKPLADTWRQLCICNEVLAEDFTQFLDKIAFVKKSQDKSIVKKKLEK